MLEIPKKENPKFQQAKNLQRIFKLLEFGIFYLGFYVDQLLQLGLGFCGDAPNNP